MTCLQHRQREQAVRMLIRGVSQSVMALQFVECRSTSRLYRRLRTSGATNGVDRTVHQILLHASMCWRYVRSTPVRWFASTLH